MNTYERVADLKGMLERALDTFSKRENDDDGVVLLVSRVVEVVHVMQHGLNNGLYKDKATLPPVKLFN